MRWKAWKAGLVTALLASMVGMVAFFLAAIGVFDIDADNPYESDGVCFAKTLPGATSRFIAFTAVSCTDAGRVLGETVGADYGVLRFEDFDGDLQPEAIVQSSAFRCRWGVAPCYDAYRIVLKVCPSCGERIQEVDRVFLKELTVDDSSVSPGER